MRKDKTGTTDAIPGELLWHPVSLAAVALIVFNNVVLKVHYPGWLSGKLSDVGICVFAPLWLHALAEWSTYLVSRVRSRPWNGLSSHTAAIGCTAIPGAYFAAMQLSPLVAEFHVAWLSMLVPTWDFQVTPDPTDLLALPFLLVAYGLIRQR